jgi:predicted nucleic acid-binding protein
MTSYVVDASVGLKWYLPEVHSDTARRLRAGGNDLNVPSLFYLEFANALWMKVRRGELDQADAEAAFAELT